jgi:iron complex outermembrane receptor protein
MKKKLLFSTLLSGAISLNNSYAQEVFSNDAGGEASSDDVTSRTSRGSRLLEEVVVTAQKREEMISDVPVSVTAYSQEKLDALGIETVQDIEIATPGVTISETNGVPVAYIRGIGTDAFLPGADTSVPFYLDGVPLISTTGSSDAIGRIERIEVLKGPQGTLFGKNATAGAISIVTARPDFNEFYGDISYEFASYDSDKVQAFINVPVLDNIAMTLSGSTSSRDNYYVNENGFADPFPDVESSNYRVKLLWSVSDNIDITIANSYNKTNGNLGMTFENTRPSILSLYRDPKLDRRVNLDQTPGGEIENTVLSATLNWALPWFDVKFIVSDQDYDTTKLEIDFDGSPLPLVSFTSINQRYFQETQEIQFTSNDGSFLSNKLNWVAGAFVSREAGGYDPVHFKMADNVLPSLLDAVGIDLLDFLAPLGGVLPPTSLFAGGIIASSTQSLYIQGNWAFSDELELTLGARYQESERNLVNGRASLDLGDGSEGVPIRNDDLPALKAYQSSPRVAVSWRPFENENNLIYGSFARAYKSPTYNSVNLFSSPAPVKSEQVDSFELGAKFDLLDGSLKLNTAVFYSEQKDLITNFVSIASGGLATMINAGDAKISGFEFDALWVPLPSTNSGFVITGSWSFLETEFTDYPNGAGFDDSTGLSFGPGAFLEPDGRDFTGNEIPRTPKSSATLGLNQSVYFGDNHGFEFGVDAYYNSGFFFTAQNSTYQIRDEYYLLNGRINYFYYPWDLQITAFARNITETEYTATIYPNDFGINSVMSDPSVYGMRFSVGF